MKMLWRITNMHLTPVKEIRSREGELHFKRWYLLKTPWFQVFIHYFERPDFDDHLHDHPWSFVSVVLWGGYIEMLRKGHLEYSVVTRNPGSIAYRKATWFHQVISLFGPTYTLVFATPRFRIWGYDKDGRWVDNETYRKEKHDENVRSM